MALQDGHIRLTGTIGDITYYKIGDTFFARYKTRIDRRMFWHDRRFAGSRQSCQRFADGNKLASRVYRKLPKEERKYERFCKLKSAAIIYLKNNYPTQQTVEQLQRIATSGQPIIATRIKRKKQRRRFPYAIEVGSNYIHMSAGRWQYLQRTIPEPTLIAMARAALETIPLKASPPAYNRQSLCA